MLKDRFELDKWINYKQRFYWMYGVHIYEHYFNTNQGKEPIQILRYEIIYC